MNTLPLLPVLIQAKTTDNFISNEGEEAREPRAKLLEAMEDKFLYNSMGYISGMKLPSQSLCWLQVRIRKTSHATR